MSGYLTSAIEAALSTEGLWLLALAVVLGGLVRGFTGFGTAMIYLPFASSVLPPVWAVISLMVFDLFGPLPNIPRAFKDGTPRDVGWLGLGALIGIPLGLFLLFRLEPDIFRWLVALISLFLLVLLISGWRYKGVLKQKMMVTIGAVSGFLGGVVGLPGPPVILLYMSSSSAIASIRANILLYLVLFDLFAFGVMAVSERLALTPVIIGAILTLPYLFGNVLGAMLFRPEREKTYRIVAYMLIAAAALSNLPIWSNPGVLN